MVELMNKKVIVLVSAFLAFSLLMMVVSWHTYRTEIETLKQYIIWKDGSYTIVNVTITIMVYQLRIFLTYQQTVGVNSATLLNVERFRSENDSEIFQWAFNHVCDSVYVREGHYSLMGMFHVNNSIIIGDNVTIEGER